MRSLHSVYQDDLRVKHKMLYRGHTFGNGNIYSIAYNVKSKQVAFKQPLTGTAGLAGA